MCHLDISCENKCLVIGSTGHLVMGDSVIVVQSQIYIDLLTLVSAEEQNT